MSSATRNNRSSNDNQQTSTAKEVIAANVKASSSS